MDEKKFAQALDACLDAVLSGEKSINQAVAIYPAFADRLQTALEAAIWLHDHGFSLEPRPNFIQSNRRYVLDQIKAEASNTIPAPKQNIDQLRAQTTRRRPLPKQNVRFPWKPVMRFAFALLLVVAITFSTSQIASASENALPGDSLYPVKLSLENIRLAVTLDAEEESVLRMQYAQKRIDEAEERVGQGQPNLIKPALENYQGHIRRTTPLINEVKQSKLPRAEALATDFAAAKARHAASLGFMLESVSPDIALLIGEIEHDLDPNTEDLDVISGVPTPTNLESTTDILTPEPTQPPNDQEDGDDDDLGWLVRGLQKLIQVLDIPLSRD